MPITLLYRIRFFISLAATCWIFFLELITPLVIGRDKQTSATRAASANPRLKPDIHKRLIKRQLHRSYSVNHVAVFFTFVLWTFVLCAPAQADTIFLGKTAQSGETDFSAEEKKLFKDALHKFKKYELKKIFTVVSVIQWLDNDHIVFSTRRLPGWEAALDEPSRIVTLNVTDNTYVVSSYTGKLFCLNHQGDMLVRRGGLEILRMSQDITYEWLAGKWGNELTHISQPPNSFISNYLCQFLPSSDTLPTEDKNKQIDSGSRQMMLLPGHGYLKNFLADRHYMSSGPVYHVKDDSSQQRVSDRYPFFMDFYFYPWLNAYFEKASLKAGPRIFYPSGLFSNVAIPKLFADWLVTSPATAIGGVLTKAGMVWDAHQDRGAWKKQGIFLDSENGLIRIEEGSGTYSIVSPNGCRVIDNIVRGDPYRFLPQVNIWMVIDICETTK